MFLKAAMEPPKRPPEARQLGDNSRKALHRSQSYPPQPGTDLDARNVGFRLLKKIGWEEGSGLGAGNQGPKEPLQLPIQKGNEGLGFKTANTNANKTTKKRKRDGAPSDAKGGVNVAELVAAEMASETTEQKVQLHRHRTRAEMKAQRDRTIQSYMYRAFKEPSGADTADTNPLYRNPRLTSTNPLID